MMTYLASATVRLVVSGYLVLSCNDATPFTVATATTPPNFVILFADDVGYASLSLLVYMLQIPSVGFRIDFSY